MSSRWYKPKMDIRMAMKLRWVVENEKIRQKRKRGIRCLMKIAPRRSLHTTEVVYVESRRSKAIGRVKLRTCDDARKKKQGREGKPLIACHKVKALESLDDKVNRKLTLRSMWVNPNIRRRVSDIECKVSFDRLRGLQKRVMNIEFLSQDKIEVIDVVRCMERSVKRFSIKSRSKLLTL